MTTIVPRYETGRVDAWKDRAACLGQDPRQWDDDAPTTVRATARATCLNCPVLAECLADAMSTERRGGNRGGIKAALSPAQRDWLQKQIWRGAAYDAEEARLLALESQVSGRPVKSLAKREGVTGLTASLAERLRSERQPAAAPARPKGVRRAGEKVTARLTEVIAWRDQGVSLAECGQRVGVSEKTVKAVLVKHLGVDPGEGVPRGERLEDAITQIVEYLRMGLTYEAIDERMGVSAGYTCQRVTRWRAKVKAEGGTLAVGLGRRVGLTQAQVVEMRERAQAGVTDLEQSLKYGLSPSHIGSIVNGSRYASFGGPIRPKHSGQPSMSTRQLWAGGQASFLKDAS